MISSSDQLFTCFAIHELSCRVHLRIRFYHLWSSWSNFISQNGRARSKVTSSFRASGITESSLKRNDDLCAERSSSRSMVGGNTSRVNDARYELVPSPNCAAASALFLPVNSNPSDSSFVYDFSTGTQLVRCFRARFVVLIARFNTGGISLLKFNNHFCDQFTSVDSLL